MRHRDQDPENGQAPLRSDPQRTFRSEDRGPRPSPPEHERVTEHQPSPGRYSAVRATPGRSGAEPAASGPAGYAPRESEQEFAPAWDARSGGDYGRSYGSRSAEGSYGRGMSPGGHRGRGPRGFMRSDSRIAEDINERLTDDEGVDASDIVLSVEQGVVTLEGHVPERRMKHRAEDLAASCGVVVDVFNRLRVRREGRQDEGRFESG